jgi:hypothetical protein
MEAGNFQTGEKTKLPPKFIQSQEREIEFHERTKWDEF